MTWGYVLRDPARSSLATRYGYGDYCTGALNAATVRNNRLGANGESQTLGSSSPAPGASARQ